MPTAKQIAKPLYTEFARNTAQGGTSSPITFGRSRDGNIDTELLASVRLAIRELCEV